MDDTVPPPQKLICPECGVDMADRDPIGHRLSHFPAFMDPARTTQTARDIAQLIEQGGITQAEYDRLKGV